MNVKKEEDEAGSNLVAVETSTRAASTQDNHGEQPQNTSQHPDTTTTTTPKPINDWQRRVGWWMMDVLMNLVILNLAAEFVKTIRVDRFSISIFMAVVLTALLDAIVWLEHKVQHYLCVVRQRKILGGFFMWLIVFSSKFLFLWVDDIIFVNHIDLGKFKEILILSAVLMLSEAMTRKLWKTLGDIGNKTDDEDKEENQGDSDLPPAVEEA